MGGGRVAKREEVNRIPPMLPPSAFLQDLFAVLLMKNLLLTKKSLLPQLDKNSCETFQIKKLYTLVSSFKSHLLPIVSALHKPGQLADSSSAPAATSRENPTCISHCTTSPIQLREPNCNHGSRVPKQTAFI